MCRISDELSLPTVHRLDRRQRPPDDQSGEHYDGDANVVEVYVGYLRKKVDVPFRRAAIETVRGAGYRLRPDGG